MDSCPNCGGDGSVRRRRCEACGPSAVTGSRSRRADADDRRPVADGGRVPDDDSQADDDSRGDDDSQAVDDSQADDDRWQVDDRHQPSQRGSAAHNEQSGPGEGGLTRRHLLLGAGGAVAAWYLFVRDSTSEEQRVKDAVTQYYTAVREDDQQAAERLVHSESPQRESLTRTGRDIRVEGFEAVSLDGDFAEAEVSVTFDTGTGTGEGSPNVELRTEDGNWRIWRFT